MKEHRRTFQQRRSALLFLFKKWMTGDGALQKYCIQPRFCFLLVKKKRHSAKSAVIWKQSKSGRCSQCRWKVYLLRTRRRYTSVYLNARKQQRLIVKKGVFHKKTQKERAFLPFASKRIFLKNKIRKHPLIATEELKPAAFRCAEQEHLDKVTQLPSKGIGSPPEDGGRCTATLSVKRNCCTAVSEDEVKDLLVTLHNQKKKNCNAVKRYHTRISSHIKKKFSWHSRKRVFSFMMCNKLSLTRFSHWMLKLQKFRSRSRRLKSKRVTQTWVQKVISDRRENCRGNSEREVCSLACLESKANSFTKNRSLSSNMSDTSAASGLVGGNKVRAPVKLQENEEQLEKTLSSNQNVKNCHQSLRKPSRWEEVDQAPTVNSCPELRTAVAEKKTVASSKEAAETNHVTGSNEIMLLEASKALSNDHVSGSGPIAMEPVPLGTASCQMDVAGSTNSDVFSTELLDHPYCKSPFEAPLSEGPEVKSDKQKGRVKNGQKIISRVPDEQLASCISGFLAEVMKKYGSLIPLCEKDVLARLKEVFNEDFSGRRSFITKEITRYRAKHPKPSVCNFQVIYNKHMLDMDDLATLDGQNWLNDQVINMYGELIMDTDPSKVHFFNSFFHRQLVTKGYNGVKRWTKKVDLFKKTLLLIPIHLEVHWSLITVNIPNRIISFYDSQGIHFKFCVENIRKYLLTEAKEKNHPEFLQGWQTAVTKCIPQQKNDSDCGVFVLQYCKCLALDQPFQFSQDDMPRVRKRIYKELCECRLTD